MILCWLSGFGRQTSWNTLKLQRTWESTSYVTVTFVHNSFFWPWLLVRSDPNLQIYRL